MLRVSTRLLCAEFLPQQGAEPIYDLDAADEAKNLHPLDASGASSAATAALLHQQLRPYVKVSLHGGEFAGAASLLRACVHGGEFALELGLGSP